MRTLSLAAVLGGTTALVAPLAGAAQAQTAQPAETLTQACAQLLSTYEGNQDTLSSEFADAPTVAQANVDADCVVYLDRVERVGMAGTEGDAQATEGQVETQSFSETETVTETVEITQEAVVEGEVIVRMPQPEVAVEQPGAEVEIREATAAVEVDQEPATIVIRQAPATINLEMPQPTITIDQPAPEIVVTMPPPGVRLDKGVPEVSFNMPEPTVTVTQPDPELDVQVQARLVDPGTVPQGEQPQVTARTEPLDAANTQAVVNLQTAEPVVRVVPAEQEQTYAYNSAEPQVQFEASDPQVNVTTAGEPTVQIRQVGEPTVRFEQGDAGTMQEGNAAPAAGAGTDTAAVAPADAQAPARARMSPEETAAFLAEPQGGMARADRMAVNAADLDGRDVITANGDEVGEIEDVVTNGNRLFVIVEHGGFLGIGDSEVALPLDRIALRGDEVVLMGLTEEDLQAMPDYDQTANVGVDPTTPVDIDTLAN